MCVQFLATTSTHISILGWSCLLYLIVAVATKWPHEAIRAVLTGILSRCLGADINRKQVWSMGCRNWGTGGFVLHFKMVIGFHFIYYFLHSFLFHLLWVLSFSGCSKGENPVPRFHRHASESSGVQRCLPHINQSAQAGTCSVSCSSVCHSQAAVCSTLVFRSLNPTGWYGKAKRVFYTKASPDQLGFTYRKSKATFR